MLRWFVGKGKVTMYVYIFCTLIGMEALLHSLLNSALEKGQ